MATKKELELARAAGTAAAASEPVERRHPDSCPFELGTEERAAWLAGFGEVVEAADPVNLTKAISDAVAINDEASA